MANAMRTERDQLRKNIESGKIKGKAALKKARGRMYYINGQLKKDFDRRGDEVAAKSRAIRKPRNGKGNGNGKAIDPKQPHLPGFLNQIDATVEEMAADLINTALQRAIANQLEAFKRAK